jgi:hypothetical protein
MLLRLAVCLLCWTIAVTAAPLLTLHEGLGVAHPDQVVVFTPPPGTNLAGQTVVDDQGRPVPWQALSDGRLAIRTDLPLGARRSFSLQPGAVAVPPGVTLTETPTHLELANDRLAVRLPVVPADLAATPAPLQGVRLADGTWTGLGPNRLDRAATAMTVTVLERGPLLVRVAVRYELPRGELRGAYEPEVIPAGQGSYTCTLELQAGQPSLLVEEEGDVELAWSLDVHPGLLPDRARYRGHHSTEPKWGRDADGKQYGAVMTAAGINYVGSRGQDALVDLDYDSGYRDPWSRTTYGWVSHWDPWSINTGWYWQLHSSANDLLLGLYAGPADRLIGPGWSGVSLDTQTIAGERQCRLQVKLQRLMPTQRYARHLRFGWRLFVGRTSTDLAPPREVQPINRQMNLHSGVNLALLGTLPEVFPDPPGGYGGLYVRPEVIAAHARELQDEAAAGAQVIYRQMLAEDSTMKLVLDLWREPTAARADALYAPMTAYFGSYFDTLVNGEGIYQHSTHYFMGCLATSQYLLQADQLLATGLLPADQAAQLKRQLAATALLLWQDNLAPMQPGININLGPANMVSMWRGNRYKYTAFLAAHPLMQPRLAQVREAARQLVEDSVSAEGASTACPHYTGASMVPVLDLLQLLQRRGVLDGCAEFPRLRRYAEQEMQWLTPPEVRFGGQRKLIAEGDGSTEAAPRIGQLGTAFAAADAALSARLMGAWAEQGHPHNAFHGSSMLKIAPALPSTTPALGDDAFPGAFGVLRHGWGTAAETAAWLIAGDTLSDHRHNDQGSLVYYALGTPIALDYGPIYYPRVSGALMHSGIVAEQLLTRPWDSDPTPLDLPAGNGGHSEWRPASLLPLSTAPAQAGIGMTARLNRRAADLGWQRTMVLHRADAECPVLVVTDDLSGTDATKPAILTWLLAAEGPFQAPWGEVTPAQRVYDWRTPEQQQLPSASPARELAPGLHRFRFTGEWGTAWDLYLEVPAGAQLSWGHWAHVWHPAQETQQFSRAHGRPFREGQTILRVRGTPRFRSAIVAWRGERDAMPTLELVEGRLQHRRGDRLTPLP